MHNNTCSTTQARADTQTSRKNTPSCAKLCVVCVCVCRSEGAKAQRGKKPERRMVFSFRKKRKCNARKKKKDKKMERQRGNAHAAHRKKKKKRKRKGSVRAVKSVAGKKHTHPVHNTGSALGVGWCEVTFPAFGV